MTDASWPAAHAAAALPVLEGLGDVEGKAVLVRLDLNVPLIEEPDGTRRVGDDFRIRAALPTLEYLRSRGARITVASHLGRPSSSDDTRFSLAPVSARLAELGFDVEMTENLRYFAGEESNSPDFVATLVAGKDCYVDDAFGVMHRAHASVVGPPRLLASAAGRLVERELAALMPLLSSPPRPFVVVIGGAKVSDKIGVVRRLVAIADRVLVGGGMAFTFLAALGHEVGDSLLERDRLVECRELISSAGAKLLLPVDVVAGSPAVEVASAARWAQAPAQLGRDAIRVLGRDVPPPWRGLDIGSATTELFRETILGAATVLWNGPMGVFEDERFARGTLEVASALAMSPATTVVGGGDSVAALSQLGPETAARIDHVSTGGGACLELLEHGDLPGLQALREAAEPGGHP